MSAPNRNNEVVIRGTPKSEKLTYFMSFLWGTPKPGNCEPPLPRSEDELEIFPSLMAHMYIWRVLIFISLHHSFIFLRIFFIISSYFFIVPSYFLRIPSYCFHIFSIFLHISFILLHISSYSRDLKKFRASSKALGLGKIPSFLQGSGSWKNSKLPPRLGPGTSKNFFIFPSYWLFSYTWAPGLRQNPSYK